MLRYTIMRLGIFFGCLLLFWLLGLRNDQVLLLLLSAVVSVVLSFFLLRRQRDEFAEKIASKLEQRQEARRVATDTDPTDEQVEDEEIGAAGLGAAGLGDVDMKDAQIARDDADRP